MVFGWRCRHLAAWINCTAALPIRVLDWTGMTIRGHTIAELPPAQVSPHPRREFPVPQEGRAPQRRERVQAADDAGAYDAAYGANLPGVGAGGSLDELKTGLDAAHRKASQAENWRL